MYAFVEWLWTAIAFTGLIVSGVAYVQARQDVMFLLRGKYNGRRMIIARGHERREALRFLVQALGAYVGIYALRLPNPSGTRLNFATFALMTMQAIVVANTVFDHRDRTKLRDYWQSVDLDHVAENDRRVHDRRQES